MEREIDNIRKCAYGILHLIFVKYVGPTTYKIVNSEDEGGVPVLSEYISFHNREALIRVKDIQKDVIYLLTPEQFKNSLLETLLKKDVEIEKKLRCWFPFLWGERRHGDLFDYECVIRKLREYL